VGSVAAVTIALNDRFVGICLEKLYLGVKMTGITNRVRPVFQHGVKIRPVGVMAGTAGSLGKRLVADVACLIHFGFRMTCEAQFFFRGQKQIAIIGGVPFMARQTSAVICYCFVRALQGHVFIRMANKTQGVARPGKQPRTLGGMGIVTGITLAFLKGRMLHGAAGLELRCLVAFQAEAAARLSDTKGLLRSGGVVAFIAFSPGYRFMGAGFQEFGLLRRVRIMTAVAGRGLHRIIPMGGFESCLFNVMTGKTQRPFLGFKKIRLIRTVSEVTGGTGFSLQGFVDHFFFEGLLLMALVAKFPAGGR